MSLSQNGFTPLHVSSQAAHFKVVRVLLQLGASVKATLPNGHTALHLAANAGAAEATRVLLQGGAEVDARTKVSERGRGAL